MKLKIKKDLACRRIAGELFIVDAAGSRLHELNPAGALIWGCLAAGKSPAAAAGAVAAEFQVDGETAARDAGEFIQELLKAGLLSESGD